MIWYRITSPEGRVLYTQSSSKKAVIEWLGRFEKLYTIEMVEM